MELVRIEDVNKKFCKKFHWSLWYGFVDLFALRPTKKLRKHEKWALTDVNFAINQGDFIGILGKNGSGKTTLVRIIIGTYQATVGKIISRVSIIPLFVGTQALNRFYSGIDNYFFTGAIIGVGRKELKSRVPVLQEFSGLGDDIYSPMGTYSSGMRIKLRFGAVKAIDPGLIIIDEALSVSDEQFQKKCFEYLKEFSASKAVVFISHDISLIRKHCNRIIIIDKGSVIYDAKDVEAGIEMYQNI